mgnify:CR=1 FL=1
MAIRGYSSGTQDTSSVPVVDVTTELNNGDMLYFDKEKNIFRGGPGIILPTKLSELQNDREFVTDYQLQAAIGNAVLSNSNGGTVDLGNYAQKTYVDGLFAQASLGNHFSGDYNDLANKPTIPAAFSGDYNDLANKPTIPAAPDLSAYITSSQLNGAILNIQQFSGDYNDLANKPTIPSVDGLSSVSYVDSQIAIVNSAIQNGGGNVDLTAYSTTQQINALITNAINAQTLFSGNYNDLINKPTMPDISEFLTETQIDAKLAAAVTGGTVDLSSYVTENELTTALSNYQPSIDLSGYVSTAQLATEISNIPPTDLSSYVTQTALNTQLLNLAFFSGDYNDLANAPSIPSINGLSTIAYVDSQVAALNSSIANVASGGSIDLSSYSTTAQMNAAISAASLNSGSGNVDLTGYATETFVQQQISSATLGAIANINDLNDVAIDGTETATHALMYNSFSTMWENVDLTENWASKDYVTAQLLSFSTDGTIDLEGYASESWVEQKLVERGYHFSGNYHDLVNTPVLFSGDYRDLANAPADNSDLRLVLNGSDLQLQNIDPEPDTIISSISLDDLGEAVSSYINYHEVQNLPNIFSGDYTDLVNRPNLFSGNYLDLANKPYIPSIAGLATEDYVDNKHAAPNITGDRNFTHNVEFRADVKQVVASSTTTAQKRDLVFAVETTNAIDTEVSFNDGTFITLADNTTAKFSATFVATSGTAHGSFTISGIVHKTAGNLVAIGNNSYEITQDSDLNWTGTVSVNPAYDRVKVTVQGSENTTVDWVVFVELTEVTR